MTKQSEPLSDFAGLGKLAKAIPPGVYKKTAATVLTTFEQLAAPLTATTVGFGELIKQRFATMVEVQRAIAAYTLEDACVRAQAKLDAKRAKLTPISHPKSFVRAFEEAAIETDPLLHEMWTNLLASQIAANDVHPFFVDLLSRFSPEEAQILASLNEFSQLGENGGRYIMINLDTNVPSWIRHADDIEPKPWTGACILLCEFRVADLVSLPGIDDHRPSILYRTSIGTRFLRAVSR